MTRSKSNQDSSDPLFSSRILHLHQLVAASSLSHPPPPPPPPPPTYVDEAYRDENILDDIAELNFANMPDKIGDVVKGAVDYIFPGLVSNSNGHPNRYSSDSSISLISSSSSSSSLRTSAGSFSSTSLERDHRHRHQENENYDGKEFPLLKREEHDHCGYPFSMNTSLIALFGILEKPYSCGMSSFQ